jgi:hypothetical protein
MNRRLAIAIVPLVLIGVTPLVWAGGGGTLASQPLKTIRLAATLIYSDYDTMLSQADAIFVGRPTTSLSSSKGTIKFFPDKVHIEDYYTLRDIKIARVIKNKGLTNIKSGNTVQLLERAVIMNVAGQPTRMISEDYEEMLERGKYSISLNSE